MRKFLYGLLTLFVCVCAGALFYGAKGYFDARSDGALLRARADTLIASGKGADDLGKERLGWLLKVEDPNFYHHSGMDISTSGAGITTITQSLSKRLAFENYKPGFGKIRQTGYAMGLNQELSKNQILALFLDTVEMGKSANGWVKGFQNASHQFYGRSPQELSDDEYLSLVSVMIAPAQLNLNNKRAEVDERVRRIKNLVSDKCTPNGNNDVWLEACK